MISIEQLTNLLVIIKSEEDFPGDMNTGDRIYCEKAERNTLLCYFECLFLELQEGWKISWNKKGLWKAQNKSKRKQHVESIFS